MRDWFSSRCFDHKDDCQLQSLYIKSNNYGNIDINNDDAVVDDDGADKSNAIMTVIPVMMTKMMLMTTIDHRVTMATTLSCSPCLCSLTLPTDCRY